MIGADRSSLVIAPDPPLGLQLPALPKQDWPHRPNSWPRELPLESLSEVQDYLALTTVRIGGKLKFGKARHLPKVIQGVNDKAGTKARSPTSQGMG